MKRADDFRAYISTCHTLDESVGLLPDIPDACDLDYLEEVCRTKPVADNPYEKSVLRPEGLKIWDSVYIPIPSAVSLTPKSRRELSILRSINTDWEPTKEALNMIGRPDGVHYLRPRGKFILDLLNDDLRLLQGAHILTHRVPIDHSNDDYTFGQTADRFLNNLIKLFLARTYGLPVNVHPERDVTDAFSAYGLEVVGSTDLRSPTLLIAVSGESRRLVPDKTVIVVLGSVGIEAHPKHADDNTDWRELDKWSCLPTLITLSGWECIDYLTHTERTELGGETFYAIPCSDLQGMSSFSEIIDLARMTLGEIPTNSEVYRIPDWFSSEDFKKGLELTPQLPCPLCLRLNTGAEGVIRRPRGPKPRQPLREIEQTRIPELKAWVDYVHFMNNCITIGRQATAYALGSVTTVQRRNKSFKCLLDKQHKIAYLENKRIKKLEQGYVTESEQLGIQIEKLKKEMA